jgi:GNAT superfamily N-acetyltransferase
VRVVIRRAISSDADALAELYLRARRAATAAGTIPALGHDADDVGNWVSQVVIPRLECWVAERSDGALVGTLVLDDDWIDQLYVDPELTSAGIGAQLLAVAKRQRPRGLQLWTFVSNKGAQRFYLRHAFREMERTDGTGNEERAPDVRYAWLPGR